MLDSEKHFIAMHPEENEPVDSQRESTKENGFQGGAK